MEGFSGMSVLGEPLCLNPNLNQPIHTEIDGEKEIIMVPFRPRTLEFLCSYYKSNKS